MKRLVLSILLTILQIPLVSAHTDKLNTRIGGRFLLDGIGYFNAADTLSPCANITDLRLTGTANYGDWFMRIDVGFDGNHLGMKDTFLQYSKNGNYFRIGHMLNSFGIDPAVSTYDYQFINCANITGLFYFGRHIGASYIRSAPKYYFSVNAFAGDNISNINTSMKQGFNAAARGVWRPIMEETRQLQFGVSALYRKPDTDKRTGLSNITLSSTGVTSLSSPNYQYLSLDDAKDQIQLNAEFLMVREKWMLQSEYLATFIQRDHADTYIAQGAYIQAGYMILGTGYGYDTPEAVPTAPLQPKSLQLLARYNFSLLNDPNTGLNGGNQQDISVGLAYQFTKHVSSRLIWSYVNLDKHSPMGARDLNMIQARIAFWF